MAASGSQRENSPALRRYEIRIFRMPAQLMRKKAAYGNHRFVLRSKTVERLAHERRTGATAFPARFDFGMDDDHDMVECVVLDKASHMAFDQGDEARWRTFWLAHDLQGQRLSFFNEYDGSQADWH
jgi:hypothetical protein